MKNKKLFKGTAIALACVLLAGPAVAGSAVTAFAVDQQDIENAQNEINKKEQAIQQLDQTIAGLTANISDTKAYIKGLDDQISTLTTQLIECRNNIAAKQGEIDTLQVSINSKLEDIAAKQADISNKQAEIEANEQNLTDEQAKQEKQYDDMSKRIQYMYECGEDSFLDMIFSSENLADMLGRTEYISNITSYDRNQLGIIMDTKNNISDLLVTLNVEKTQLEEQEAQLVEDEADLENQKAALESQKNDLVGLQTELENQQEYIDHVRAAKNASLTELEDQESASETQLEALKQELEDEKKIKADLEARWKKEQEEAEKNNQDTGELAQHTLEEIGLTGGFTWPIPGYNWITSEWSPRRLHPLLGVYKMHDGMDISGGGIDGKPIVAAYDGTVILAEYYYGYGNCVQISHGPGVVTLYAHCSALAVTAGQQVKAGQTIGYVGSTGNSTGPHLHLTLFLQGVSVNPRDYFTIPVY